MKQNGLKGLFDTIFESSLISSSTFTTLVNNVRLVALETKKLAEIMLVLKDRLDKQEILLMSLHDQKNDSQVFEYTKSGKTRTSKPN